jgi:broad specificity phosphatase PhoE
MSVGTAYLWLVRHGQTDFNLAGRLQGSEVDIDLNDLGRRQAMVTAEFLSDHVRLHRLYCSPLQRAQSTAAILARVQADRYSARSVLPIVLDARLREKSTGQLNGTTAAQRERWFAQQRLMYRPDLPPGAGEADLPVPGAETSRQVAARSEDFVMALIATLQGQDSAETRHDSKEPRRSMADVVHHIGVVSHGIFARHLLANLFPDAAAGATKGRMVPGVAENCSLSAVRVDFPLPGGEPLPPPVLAPVRGALAVRQLRGVQFTLILPSSNLHLSELMLEAPYFSTAAPAAPSSSSAAAAAVGAVPHGHQRPASYGQAMRKAVFVVVLIVFAVLVEWMRRRVFSSRR